jgi:hypothetical protein
MLARHITTEPELPNPEEPDTANTFVFKHGDLLVAHAALSDCPMLSVVCMIPSYPIPFQK